MNITVPGLNRSYEVPSKTLNPYTPAEMAKALPRLRGKSLLVDFQEDIDGPQTATRLIRETLGNFGVSWVKESREAEAIIWIQGGSATMRFAFVVAHPEDAQKFIAAECGPRELTATTMTGVCEYFELLANEAAKGELAGLLVRVNELNRAITGASLAQDWTKARGAMEELTSAVERLGCIGGSESIKPLVDALADSAQGYESTGFAEAKALRESAIEALRKFGTDAIPWLKKGTSHTLPAVRSACKRALKACRGRPWWQVW